MFYASWKKRVAEAAMLGTQNASHQKNMEIFRKVNLLEKALLAEHNLQEERFAPLIITQTSLERMGGS